MVLLPELLFRRSFGRPLLVEPEAWREAPGGRPLLDGAQDWTSSLRQLLPRDRRTRRRGRRRRRADEPSLDWMPAAWYQPHWPKMPAFALPSFYDGRIRINLEGRERHGRVSPARYASTCDELAALLQGCRDPRTSEAMVESIERVPGDPRRIGPTEADLVVVWRGSALGLEHDSLGRVGPFPMRRSGGHTGGDGLLLCSRAGPPPGDHGRRSAFDVVPTAIELLGEKPEGVSGHSVLAGAGAPAS
jgi:hypothetical protein